MQKLTNSIVPFLLLFVIISSLSSVSSTPYNLKGQTTVQYDVVQSNNATSYWSNYPDEGGYNYHIENGSQITVIFSDILDRTSELNMTVGNLTLYSATESLVQDNLALGYWSLGDTFGFLSDTNWDTIKTNLSNTDGLTSDVSTNKADFLSGKVTVEVITLVDDFQNTTLVYEKQLGLLLFAYTDVFGFVLGITINNINGSTNIFKSTSASLPISMVPVLLSLIAFSFIWKRKA